MTESRMGITVRQKGGYQAYIPKPLPPDPPVYFDDELHHLLSEADRALARLDGMTISRYFQIMCRKSPECATRPVPDTPKFLIGAR